MSESQPNNVLATSHESGPLLTCLVPVRNAAPDLPGFLASVRHYCDAVIALDDGSTDETLALLEADPLVKRIVRNPVRDGYHAWNDAANRNRLLRAAAALGPRWILSLDADERIDEGDGQALRAFLEHDAVPGFAYGFRNAPMRNGTELFWPRYIWVYRLFHYAPRQRFPMQRLHFVPIPTAIPEALRVKTTLRIQHLGELTAERRLARFAKYLEADPSRRFQDSYTASIEVVDEEHLSRWLPRPVGMPVLLEEAEADLQQPAKCDRPDCSVILLVEHAQQDVRRVIDLIQRDPAGELRIEIIAVAREWSDHQLTTIQADHPHMTVVTIDGQGHRGALRNAGLRQARGTFVIFLEAGTMVTRSGLEARIAAHHRGYTMVSGVLDTDRESPLALADLALRCHDGLPNDPAGELAGPPVCCSYARLALHESGGFPEGVGDGDDGVINRELFRRGYLAYFDPSLRLVLPPASRSPRSFLRMQMDQGRAYARGHVRPALQTGRLLRWRALQRQVNAAIRAIRRTRQALQAYDAAPRLPTTIAVGMGMAATAMGAGLEVIGAVRSGAVDLRRRRPQMVLVIVCAGTDVSAWLVQCDYLQHRLTSVPVTTNLRLQLAEMQDPLTLADLRFLRSAFNVRDLRKALADTVGIEDLHFLIGEEEAITQVIAIDEGGRLRLRPGASATYRASLQARTLSSSLDYRDVILLTRCFAYGERTRWTTKDRVT